MAENVANTAETETMVNPACPSEPDAASAERDRSGRPTGRQRRRVVGERRGVQRQGGDVAGPQHDIDGPGDRADTEGPIDYVDRTPTARMGARQPGITDAGQGGNGPTEGEGQRRRSAGLGGGHTQHGENPAPDHTADTDGHRLAKSDVAPVAASSVAGVSVRHR